MEKVLVLDNHKNMIILNTESKSCWSHEFLKKDVYWASGRLKDICQRYFRYKGKLKFRFDGTTIAINIPDDFDCSCLSLLIETVSLEELKELLWKENWYE